MFVLRKFCEMPRGKRITTAICHNKYKQRKDGTYPVAIRLIFNRTPRYYDTGYALTFDQFNALFVPKPDRKSKEILSALRSKEQLAIDIIKELGDAFTFDAFDRRFLNNRGIGDSLSDAFDRYIETISEVGTKEAYGNARSAFALYRTAARIGDVTPRFLKGFEEWMLFWIESSLLQLSYSVCCQIVDSIGTQQRFFGLRVLD